ncbi:F-box/LRR-repeat protein 12 [Gryllus bimaculatus]|nr:F-box/LRR-repeat protein 12 [Gryllus bimaculatus]
MSLKRRADESSTQLKRARCDSAEDSDGTEDIAPEEWDIVKRPGSKVAPILKLSDEMLLLIMRLLDPRDVISLGCTCRRLDAVIRDRTLWADVDLTAQPIMMCQLREFVGYFHCTTKSIVTKGCVNSVDTPVRWEQQCAPLKMFRQLNKACPALETFVAIEQYYDARHVFITDFPPSLKKLVLQGCEVYFVPSEKSYFHGINKHMPNLQELILDECQWLTPDNLMAISKCPNLRKLSLRSCRNMGTCYAYVSLSSRFGFRSLEVLDVRGSSLGDHEISCFQSIENLTHLYLEVPESRPLRPENKEEPRVPPNPQTRKMRGPLSTTACCLCYAKRTPEEDLERQRRTKQEVPMIQLATNSENSTIEFNYEMTLLAEEEYGLHTPFVEADLAEQLDPDTLITDQGIMALGTRDVVVLDSGRHPVETTVFRNPNLTDLTILNCKGVTDLTLIHLVMLSSLKNLNVCGCSVTPGGIHQFRTRRPEVKIVSDYCGKKD